MSINELLLLLAAAAMIGTAIYNGHQGLVLRGINKRLASVVGNLERDLRKDIEAERQKFEAWYCKQFGGKPAWGAFYTDAVWRGWLAANELQPPPAKAK